MTKVYKLSGITGKSPLIVDILDSNDEIFDYFMIEKKEVKLPCIITAKIQKKKDIERIKRRDVIDASIGIVIVSRKFLEHANKKIYKEVNPIKCYLSHNSYILKEYYILDIIKKIDLIDRDHSFFYDEKKTHLRHATCKHEVSEDFLIAKDISYPTVFRISKILADDISSLALNISAENAHL